MGATHDLPDRADPPGEAPWAMPLVVRVEKADRPSESAACAAAATAVVRLLTDERAAPGGPWSAAIERWLQGRIRKVARRARAHAWEAAQEPDGVTAVVDGAEVRAYVPGPTDAIPLVLSRLQIRGLQLDDPDRVERVGGDGAGAVVVALAPLAGSTSGKKVAAAGHAGQLSLAAMDDERRHRWAQSGFAVSVIQPPADGWPQLVAGAPVAVVDAGFTEVAPGTVTALAWWD